MKKYVDENYILELYHLLHRCPEIGYDLPKTVAIVKSELEKIRTVSGSEPIADNGVEL